MKIVHATPSVLVLKQHSYISMAVGLFFFVTGLYLIFSQRESKTLFLAVILIMCGLLPVILFKFITIVINKTASTISITGVGLLGKKTQTINFSQVKEVSIEEYITANTTNSGPRNQLNFNLVIYLNDGQGVPIAMDSPSVISISGIPIGGFGPRNSVMDMGNKIASFIGVPFVDRRPPTVNDVVSNISTIMQNSKPQESLNAAQQK